MLSIAKRIFFSFLSFGCIHNITCSTIRILVAIESFMAPMGPHVTTNGSRVLLVCCFHHLFTHTRNHNSCETVHIGHWNTSQSLSSAYLHFFQNVLFSSFQSQQPLGHNPFNYKILKVHSCYLSNSIWKSGSVNPLMLL